MDINTAAAWFLALVPLCFSPGPANVLFAASGSAFGIRSSLPFLLGTNLVCVMQTTAVGIGLNAVLTQSAEMQAALKWAGISVLLLLALRFFRLTLAQNAVPKPLSFREGVLIELINAKFLLIPLVMFSLFHDPTHDGIAEVLRLTTALAVLTVAANLVWVVVGKMAFAWLTRGNLVARQGQFFGIVLVMTALWLAMD